MISFLLEANLSQGLSQIRSWSLGLDWRRVWIDWTEELYRRQDAYLWRLCLKMPPHRMYPSRLAELGRILSTSSPTPSAPAPPALTTRRLNCSSVVHPPSLEFVRPPSLELVRPPSLEFVRPPSSSGTDQSSRSQKSSSQKSPVNVPPARLGRSLHSAVGLRLSAVELWGTAVSQQDLVSPVYDLVLGENESIFSVSSP